MIPIRYWIAAFLLLAGMVVLNLPNIFGQSPTVDEYAHVPAGYSYLVKKDFRLYPKNPPLIKMFCAVPLTVMGLKFPKKEWHYSETAWGPWYFGDAFTRSNVKKVKHIYAYPRIMNMFFGAILALLVFLWASQLYGPGPGLAALAFTVTSPTILAHAGVATVDMGFTLFFVAALFTFMRGSEFSTYSRVAIAGIMLGLVQISKFNGLLLFPIFICISIIILIRTAILWGKQKEAPKTTFRKIIWGEVFYLTVVFLIAFFIIHLGYLFKKSTVSLKTKPDNVSIFVKKISKSPLGKVPVLLPEYYVRGLDLQLADIERGEFPNYINGKWRKKGVKYYFLEALTLKETLPALIFIFMGLAMATYRSLRKWQALKLNVMRPAWPFVHFPAAVFLLVISLSGNLQLGVRYALPFLPLIYIAASAVLFRVDAPPVLISRKRGAKLGIVKSVLPEEGKYKQVALPAIVFALFCWQCIELARVAPHYLSHFNELAGGVEGGPRYLLDSNVDWGQDLPSLEKKMKELQIDEIGLLYFGHANPSWYGIKWHLPRAKDRYVAVSVNFLRGYPYSLTYASAWKKRPPMITDPQYRRLRELALELGKTEPMARAGGSIYIFDTAPPESNETP